MEIIKLKKTVEAILFSSGEPVSVARLSLALAIDEAEIIEVLERLKEEYVSEDRGIRLIRLENSYQLCSSADCAEEIRRVLEIRSLPKLSKSALETLAVIAYFQPVTKAYVELVRGVDSGYTVNSLADKGLVRVVGKLDVAGRPSSYGTTDEFLRVLGIESLEELPKLPETGENNDMEAIKSSISGLQMEISDIK